jgi:hypothetical protein
MSCKKCNKKRLFNLSGGQGKADSSINPVFSGWFGKIAYFLILLIVACTPIINIVAIYLFAKAVFGGNKKMIENEHQNPNIN